ncbi:MAG TPA: hypothetical protein VFQ39_02255 [Longimicrobium sp.]|nr:hypothetical protein [Longimicrobium sp.]
MNLEERQRALQVRVDQLGNLPLPVAEHFLDLTANSEKRSARRDYLLFLLGVFITALSTVIGTLWAAV